MTGPDHKRLLSSDVSSWNEWRARHEDTVPNLADIDLSHAHVPGIDLRRAHLWKTDLHQAVLVGADLRDAAMMGAHLSLASIGSADLRGACLDKANLQEACLCLSDLNAAHLEGADLTEAHLRRADLTHANLCGANLTRADLRKAKLCGASLTGANLHGANLRGADLNGADLRHTILSESNFTRANLSNCNVYGVSAWNLQLQRACQNDLRITRPGEPEVTVDNLQVAQFLYLLMHNEEIRDVIDAITSKVVLILGRFTANRKAVLDALRERLRNHNYSPVLFDFATPSNRDMTETITLLARMARFIVVDLSEPSSVPKELEAIVPTVAVPVVPLLEGHERPYSMFQDYWKYDWVLSVRRYADMDALLTSLVDFVIAPAEAKAAQISERRGGGIATT